MVVTKESENIMDQDYILAIIAKLERANDVNGLAKLLRSIVPILSDDDIEMVFEFNT